MRETKAKMGAPGIREIKSSAVGGIQTPSWPLKCVVLALILIHQLMIAKTPQTRKIREMIHASGIKHTGNSAVIGTHLNLQPPMIAVHVMEEMELARKLLKPLWLILRARGALGIGRIWKAAGFMTLMSLNLPCAVRVLRILQVIERT